VGRFLVVVRGPWPTGPLPGCMRGRGMLAMGIERHESFHEMPAAAAVCKSEANQEVWI